MVQLNAQTRATKQIALQDRFVLIKVFQKFLNVVWLGELGRATIFPENFFRTFDFFQKQKNPWAERPGQATSTS